MYDYIVDYIEQYDRENSDETFNACFLISELTKMIHKKDSFLMPEKILSCYLDEDTIYEYFRNQPFTLMADPSKTIGASLDELFEQARKRQKQNPGTQYLGAILQHLVAAKLSLILPAGKFEIHGASVADSPTERSGDFVINNTIIHCTTAPGEPLIRKCKINIRSGCLPVIITIFDRVKTALDLAADADLNGRIEVWDIQQFLATNINEHSLFDNTARNTTLADIIERYNAIIDDKETDPSLRIEFEAK
jgi:hypothetical protein